ncbi:GTP cyclohydrolase FolE2 [Rubritalea spongiae]|uniref:GTP cyclohydrolase FolE2 n=1 Tax=Rubritalea spongiae TaxID=430797 RepID=A0ABW5DZ42_9BACT
MNSSIVETPKADPQKDCDTRGIAIDHVGISNVRYPILIAGWDSTRQETKEVSMSLKVSLAPNVRGIHMSRLLEGVHHWSGALSINNMEKFLSMIRKQQESHTATVDCRFTWFVKRPTPKTELPAWQGIETTWHGHQDNEGSTVGYTLDIPVTTLCPCSREISDYGAHSQRGWVKVKLEWNAHDEIISPQEIYNKLQNAGSAPIYPLLKRADERHVTMLAYQQPAFVEDTLRKAALILKDDTRVKSFELHICNEESIHTHDAVASLSFTR